ncbi:MAG: restriction endonuclease subunit S [Eubacterium sp.]|nr:restriction endonuclease subunit S [Eubacterium sp.]
MYSSNWRAYNTFLGTVDFYHQENDYVAVVKDGAGIGRTMFLPSKSSVIGTLQYIIPNERVLPQYLYYAVKHMDLARYYTGATIPHIYYKDYKNELFWLPDISRQQEIVCILEKIEEIIEEKEQELEDLDALIKLKLVIQKSLDETQTLMDSLM